MDYAAIIEILAAMIEREGLLPTPKLEAVDKDSEAHATLGGDEIPKYSE